MADDGDKKAVTAPAPAGSPPSKSPPTDTATSAPDPNEGPGKGTAFFDRAKSVAATGNFDYAIDMYVEGLNREPFNVEQHKALRDISLRRKLAGGKAAGGLLGPKLPYKGKGPKEAMLNNEFLLAKDAGNITAMLAIVRNAVILELKDVVLWIAPIIVQANRTTKQPKKEIFTEISDLLEKLKEYSKASEALQNAIALDPNNGELVAKAMHLSAQETLVKGNYEAGESFKASIKDQEATKKLAEEENLVRSVEYRLKALATAKEEYEKNPKELQVIAKYAKSLEEMEDEEHENLAIELYKKAYTDTRIYRLKAAMGNVRMKQYKRNLRVIREAVKADPKDKALIHQYEQLNKERLAYELSEFLERSEHMPTDMLVKYELGVRMWESKRYDEAIVAFQEAQQNPKHKVDAMHLLGRSFLILGMKPEAVETLRRSIEEYELASTGDKKSKELHYYYGVALEENGKTAEAIDIYSKIIRWDIGFKDARKRLNDLRERGEGSPDA